MYLLQSIQAQLTNFGTLNTGVDGFQDKKKAATALNVKQPSSKKNYILSLYN